MAVIVASLAVMAPAFAQATTGAQFWQELGHSHFIQEGTGGPVIYDFFDPNCPYCYISYRTEQTYITAGKLTVRYVPVGDLTPTSFGKAVAILSSRNQAQALALDMAGIHQNDAGGVRPASGSSQVRQALRENESLLADTGIDTVPVEIYRLPNGKVGIIDGIFPGSAIARLDQGDVP